MTVSTQRKILNEESITLKFIEIIVIFFGLWTIYCNLFSILNLSFSSLYRYSLIFIVFSTILYHLVSKSKTVSTSGADVTPNSHKIKIPEIVKWISALCIVLLFLITESHALFWISSVCFLILIHFEKNSHGDNQKIDRCISNREIWVVLGVAILAGVITLIVHRPDADDATYLNSIVFALDFPDLPFLKYDGMHGIPDIPINIITYRIHSYEMFVAILSNFTGISPIAICHLILPPFFACFVVFTNWLVLQSTCPKMHLPALIFVLFILLIWGDSHRTYGNFSFVRLFQGKSIVVSAWIPLIFYYAFEFVKNKDIRTWILLFFAQAAAMGFSSSAIVAAPLVVFIVLTGSWRPNKNETKLVGIGILSSIYIILIGLSLFSEFRDFRGFDRNKYLPDFYESISGLNLVVGEGWLKYFALFSLLTVGLQSQKNNQKYFLTGFSLAAMILLFSPWSADWIAKTVAGNMSWRMFWALPFPLIMGICIINLYHLGCRLRNQRFGFSLFIATVVLCTIFSTKWTIAPANGTKISLPAFKIDPFYDVSMAVKNLTPDKGMVLAPEQIAKWIPTFRRYPYVIISRKMYLLKLTKFINPEEIDLRLKIHDCISGKPKYKRFIPLVIKEIKRRHIDTIVIHRNMEWRNNLAERIKNTGYRNQPFGAYDIWIKTTKGKI